MKRLAILSLPVAWLALTWGCLGGAILPPFNKYPVNVTLRKMQVPVRFDSSPGVKTFRTRILEGAAGDVNFAGHYLIVEWGCGTSCMSGVVINAMDGRVNFLPTAVWAREYHAESILLANNPPSSSEQENAARPEWAKPEYFLWKDEVCSPITNP